MTPVKYTRTVVSITHTATTHATGFGLAVGNTSAVTSEVKITPSCARISRCTSSARLDTGAVKRKSVSASENSSMLLLNGTSHERAARAKRPRATSDPPAWTKNAGSSGGLPDRRRPDAIDARAPRMRAKKEKYM